MRVNQQHSLSGRGARGLLYAGKHLKNKAGQSQKHCLQGLPNAVEKMKRANKHPPSIHKAGWQQKAWSFTCLPSAQRQPVWHEAWKNVLPSCTGWQWRNKTEDHARSDGELVPVLELAVDAGVLVGWTLVVWAPCLVRTLLLGTQSWHSCYCPLHLEWQNSELVFREVHGSERHLTGNCGAQHFLFLPSKEWASFVPALCLFFSRAQHGLGGLSGAAGESEGDLGSISWLPTTEAIPKSGEVVVWKPGGSSVILRGFPFQNATKAREV